MFPIFSVSIEIKFQILRSDIHLPTKLCRGFILIVSLLFCVQVKLIAMPSSSLSPGTIVSRKRVSLILLVLVYHMKSRYGSLLIFSDSPHIYAHAHVEKLRYVCQHAVGLIEFNIIGTYRQLCLFSIILT